MNDKNQREELEFLQNYNPNKYEKPSVTVDVLLFSMIKNKLHILLIKRGGFVGKTD